MLDPVLYDESLSTSFLLYIAKSGSLPVLPISPPIPLIAAVLKDIPLMNSRLHMINIILPVMLGKHVVTSGNAVGM